MRIRVSKDLAGLKAEARASIDRAAEAIRLRYITGGDGQAMVYQMKADEASRFLSLSEPPLDLTGFPLLQAEVGITASDPTALASLWRDMRAEWIAAAASIERLRLAAKSAVDAATCPAEIAAAKAVEWP